MSQIVFDIEADELLERASKIHVIGVCDVEDTEGYCETYRDTNTFLWDMHDHITNEPTEIIGQNIIGYDLPLLEKLEQLEYSVGKQDTWQGQPVTFVDTRHLSMFLNPDRKGGHSLANLAQLAGTFKQEYDGGFEEYNEGMEKYVCQDCVATAKVYKYLIEVDKLIEAWLKEV